MSLRRNIGNSGAQTKETFISNKVGAKARCMQVRALMTNIQVGKESQSAKTMFSTLGVSFVAITLQHPAPNASALRLGTVGDNHGAIMIASGSAMSARTGGQVRKHPKGGNQIVYVNCNGGYKRNSKF